MAHWESTSTTARVSIMLAVLGGLWTGAGAQYGPVDLAKASERVLQTTFSDPALGASAYITLKSYDPDGWKAALSALLTHPNPELRIRAAIDLARAGDPVGAVKGLPTPAERTAAAHGMIREGLVSAPDAETLLGGVEIEPTLRAILHGVDRSSPAAPLEALAADESTALFARGIAALELAERGDEKALERWYLLATALPEAQQGQLLYEFAIHAREMNSPKTLAWLHPKTKTRPANDYLRAATTLGLLHTDPAMGIVAWSEQFHETTASALQVALAEMLLSSGVAAPRGVIDPLKQASPLHQKLFAVLSLEPDARLAGSGPLIDHGHRASMAWAIGEAREQTTPESTRILESILARFHDELASDDLGLVGAATMELAKRSPEAIGQLLGSDTAIPRPFLFAALAAAGTPEATAVAQPFLEDPARATRSMALLVVANTGTLDPAQQRLLGRAAAGAGRLPARMRVPAAWVYLAQIGSLDAALDRIVGPSTQPNPQ